MKRTIIKINESLCNGCGQCVKSCHEGALQLINGKAVLVNEQHCDGLGACIGECPAGAISFEEREVEQLCEEQTVANPPAPFANEKGARSALAQWPVQLHLLSPQAPFLRNADLLLAADCVAYSLGDFHAAHLRGKRLAIACPKLDSNKDKYVEKLTAMIDHSQISALTVMMMEVPCCRGLLQLAQMALANARRKIPLKQIVVSLQGEITYSS